MINYKGHLYDINVSPAGLASLGSSTSADTVMATFGSDMGLILGLRPANERRRYKVTPSLIGLAQT